MTREEAQIILLKDSLEKCRNTIEFLHLCLMGEATYTYPEHTKQIIEEIKKYIPDRKDYCVHSTYTEGCISCFRDKMYLIDIHMAKMILKDETL